MDQVEVLEHHPDLAPDQTQIFLGGVGDVLVVPEDRTGGRFDQAVDAAQQRRLA